MIFLPPSVKNGVRSPFYSQGGDAWLETFFGLSDNVNMKLKPFRLERYFAEYEFTAPYLLCCSDCESFAIKELLALEPGAQERFQDLWLGYTESSGDPGLRQEIAALYERLSPDQILVHSGAEEAIFNFMQVMLKANDQIIVHAPFYQSLGEVAESIGRITPPSATAVRVNFSPPWRCVTGKRLWGEIYESSKPTSIDWTPFLPLTTIYLPGAGPKRGRSHFRNTWRGRRRFSAADWLRKPEFCSCPDRFTAKG